MILPVYSWCRANDQYMLYRSSPENLQCGLNLAEKITPSLLKASAGIAALAISCGLPPGKASAEPKPSM